MSIHRRAAKRDATEPAIIAALTAAGASVQPLSGEDIPDLLVAHNFNGVPETLLIEVKSKGGKLREGQRKWIAKWPGRVVVCWTVEDALIAIGRLE